MRSITKIGAGSLGILLGVNPGVSNAHHSPAMFIQDEVVIVDGTVVDVEWRMPHVYLSVEDRQGRRWLIETDGPPILVRSGWTRESFAEGDAVSARVHPSRTEGDLHGLLVSIQNEDGEVMDSFNRAGRDSEATGARASSFAGVWTSSGAQLRSFGASWRNHPLTPKGQESRAEYNASLSIGNSKPLFPRSIGR